MKERGELLNRVDEVALSTEKHKAKKTTEEYFEEFKNNGGGRRRGGGILKENKGCDKRKRFGKSGR